MRQREQNSRHGPHDGPENGGQKQRRYLLYSEIRDGVEPEVDA